MKLNQLSFKDLSIKEFIIGGVLFSLIKYTADNVNHTAVYAADTAHTTIC